MSFKNYCKLMLHVIVALLALLSLPAIAFTVTTLLSCPTWLIIVISIAAAFPTIYWMFKYIDKITDKINKGVKNTPFSF